MLDDIQAVKLEEFAISPSIVEGCIVLQLHGIGDTFASEPLRNCLTAIEGRALRGELAGIEFDIRGLQLLNSTCLKVFASFLLALLSGKRNCPIRFIVDSKSPWQARSLFALERLASSIVSIVPR